MPRRPHPLFSMSKMIFVLMALAGAQSQNARSEDDIKLPAIRDVTPSGVNRVYRSNETPALLDAGLPRFPDIQVLKNGNLRSGTKTIQLYGVVLPERKRLCLSSTGQRWACGVTAFVALRNLVQSRTIACNILADSERSVLGQCKVEQTDIAAWLLREGWAELEVGLDQKAYAEAAATAKVKSVGIWGNGPPAEPDRREKRW